MFRFVSCLVGVALVGCATTETTKQPSQSAAQLKKPKPMPNLDRTYDWGSRPPTRNPEHNED